MAFALFFPGQGAQKIGMMAPFSKNLEVKETFDEASEVIGKDLWELLNADDVNAINQTEITQPLMLTVGVATYRAFFKMGGKTPDYLAGHSLGEYTAWVVAEALDFKSAVELVKYRAECMQAAVPEGKGAMAAILGLDAAIVEEVCLEAAKETQEVVEPANYNSLGQIVIAGDKKAIEFAVNVAKARGAKRSVLLPVSVPSHCSLMYPAAKKLQQKLTEITLQNPKIKVINNVDVSCQTTSDEIKDALVRQLFSPVRWTETIQYLVKEKVLIAVECAPVKVLTDLNKRIDKDLVCTPFVSNEAIQEWLQNYS